MPESDLRIVLTTVATVADAERLANEVVGSHLAACANLVPSVKSIYWWEGKVQREDETLIVFKTTVERGRELREKLLLIHPYDVPEVIELEVAHASAAYAAWVRVEVR